MHKGWEYRFCQDVKSEAIGISEAMNIEQEPLLSEVLRTPWKQMQILSVLVKK